MRRLLFILCFILPLTSFAQYTITGMVVSKTDKSPISSASVFLNNTQIGVRTADNGSFSLAGVKAGQYDLVISCVGYETYHQTVMVSADVKLPNVELAPKAIALHEVKIMPDEEKARLFAMFKRMFIGSSSAIGECKIVNPDVIDIDYDKPNRMLTASSTDFIEIQNQALGYKIKYLLTNFSYNETEKILYFEGSALFEELKGSKHQQREWQSNRLIVYKGSSIHFLRSLISNDIYEQGFKVLRLVRVPNPSYAWDNSNQQYKETLYTKPLVATDMVKRTDVSGLFALTYDACLYVMYSAEMNATPVDKLLKDGQAVPDYLNNYITTTVIFEKPYAVFDLNGIFIDPSSVIFDGKWGNSRVAEMLPVDYQP